MSLATRDGILSQLSANLNLFRDVGVLMGARIIGALSAVVFTAIMSRAMGADGLGQISVTISLAMVLGLLCTLNIEAGGVRFMVKYIAQDQPEQALQYIRFARRYISALCLIVVPLAFAVLYWRAGGIPTPTVWLAIAAAPLLAWLRLNSGIAMGFSRPVLAMLPLTFLRQVLFVAMLWGWVTLQGDLTPSDAAYIFAIGLVCVVVIHEALMRPHLAGLRARVADTTEAKPEHREWISVGFIMGLNILFVEFSVYLTVLAASFVLPDRELAFLDVTLKIMALVKFGLTAINQVFLPKISKAVALENWRGLTNWLAVSNILKLVALMGGLLVIWLFGQLGLSFFGPEFVAAYPLLILLMLDPVLQTLAGPGANIVSLSKSPQAMLPFLCATLTVLVAGTFVLGTAYGTMGVAVAVVLTRAVWTVGLALYCRRRLAIDPSIFSLPSWFLNRR